MDSPKPEELPWEHDESCFTIERELRIGDYILLWVNYPKCPNPDKVMVLNSWTQPMAWPPKKLFPHFGRRNSPIARFPATEEGWYLAIRFVQSMNVRR